MPFNTLWSHGATAGTEVPLRNLGGGQVWHLSISVFFNPIPAFQGPGNEEHQSPGYWKNPKSCQTVGSIEANRKLRY